MLLKYSASSKPALRPVKPPPREALKTGHSSGGGEEKGEGGRGGGEGEEEKEEEEEEEEEGVASHSLTERTLRVITNRVRRMDAK